MARENLIHTAVLLQIMYGHNITDEQGDMALPARLCAHGFGPLEWWVD